MWLIWGAVAAARACRHAENAPDSLRDQLLRIVGDGCRAPRLLTSSRVTTAVALGLRWPTILLPAGLLQEGSPQAIRAILTHEWAHIRNGDLWLLALGRCLLVLLFPHPLLWWLRRAIRGDQELLADAAAAGDNRPAYAEQLLRLVRKTAYPSPIAATVAVGIWESPTQLSRRIAMLLDESFHVEPSASRRWRYWALGLLLILGAACSLMTLQPARSQGHPAQANTSAAPRVIRPLDVLQIRIYNAPTDPSMNGEQLVFIGGQVSLGHMYGQVKVLGLTRKEAEAAIREKLRETVPDPQVEVTIRGREAPWTADTLQPANSAAKPAEAKGQAAPHGGTIGLTGSPANQTGDGGPSIPIKTGSGTLTLTGSQASQRALNLGDHSEGFDPTFQLPVHPDLCNANSRKRFGIEFSAEQWKKLRAISADWQKQSKELSTKDRPKTTDQKQLEKFWTLVEPKLIDLIQSYGKQVDAVLTPEQLQKYQRFKTGECVRQPQFLKSMGVELTREQQKKVEQADREDAEKWYQDLDRETQLVVAALSREQREQLRIAVGQESSASEEFTWKLACQSKPDEIVTKEGGHFNWVVPDAKYANLASEQRAIQYTPVAKKLELTAHQQKQLSALDAEQESKTEKLLGETLKLPQDQRNRPEVSEKAARIRKETRQRIDAILTPRQRDVLKDHKTESWALKVFRQSLPENPNTAAFGSQQKITLNEQQLAIVRRVLQDVATKMELNNRESDRRSSDILTEEQQNKIRDYYIKLRAW